MKGSRVPAVARFQFPPGVGYPFPRDVVIGKDLTVRAIKSSFDALIEQLLAE